MHTELSPLVSLLVLAAPLAAQQDTDFPFSSTFQQLTTTLVNPYDGQMIAANGGYYVNDSVYVGSAGVFDRLLMNNTDDFLTLEDGLGGQTLVDIEFILAGAGNDIVDLSHATFVLGDVIFSAGQGDDIIWANVGDDNLIGSSGDDILHGGPGADILSGSSDDDTLDGGAGADSAKYFGPFGDYSVTDNAGVLTVQDLVGSDGTDTVVNVETLVFSDGVYQGGVFTPGVAVRLGTPPNPNALSATFPPVIGGTWTPVLDHTTFLPAAVLDLVGVSLLPINLPLPPYGTVLCDIFTPPGLLYTFSPPGGVGTPFAIPIPIAQVLVGVSLCAQGASLDANGTTLLLTNALDIVIAT